MKSKFNFGIVITSLLLLLLLLSNPGVAEETNDAVILGVRPVPLLQVDESRAPLQPIILRHDPSYISTLHVPPPRELALQQQGLMAVQATISINYLPAGPGQWGDICVTWPDQPKAAFTYAANLWASQLQSSVPITIDACWANNLPAGILGHSGAKNYFRNFSGAPVANTWYAVSLANALHGSDLDPGQSDMYIGYSNSFNWYFGTDATPPSQVDFVSVVLHEITHSLGFSGSMQISEGQGSWGLGTPYPDIYDRFTENGSGQKLIDTALFPNPSAVLATQLTSNDIYFNGANANAGNGGARVPLYAPATWSPGSSYAHLAESYNNTPNALMTYALPNGESIHNPGPVTLGLLKDIGWALQQASNNYTLTLAKAGTGDGTVSGGGAYAAGATVNLIATPDANSTFSGWSPSPCAASFTMPANNLTCTATFNRSPSAQPDLVITSVTSPGSGVAGGQITGALTVKNQGTQAAGSFWVGFYLSSDSTITSSDINTGWGCTISSLAAGAPWECGGTVGIPASVSPGTYYLGGYADPGNTVSESSETNNGGAATNPITITGSSSTYTLTLAKTGTGNGTVSGGGNYAAGATVTLTATANAGSTFAGWSPSPCAASFSMPANNLTCTATFNAINPSSLLLAGLTANGQIYYTPNLATWTQIAGQLNQILIGDLNQDGRKDLVGLTTSGQIYYTINLSTWTQLSGELSQIVMADDLDGAAGWSDLAGIASDGSIWYTGETAWTRIPGALSQIAVGDFDGDGQANNLAGLASNGSIWYTTNLNTWTQIPGVLSQLVAGDLNGDGTDDLAGLASDGSIWYTINTNYPVKPLGDNSVRVFSPWTQIPGGLSQIVAGDLNGDGADDLAGLASNGSIWYTTDLNTWAQIPGGLSQLRATDLNGDGKADLAGIASNGTIWYTTNLSAWTNIPGQLATLAGY